MKSMEEMEGGGSNTINENEDKNNMIENRWLYHEHLGGFYLNGTNFIEYILFPQVNHSIYLFFFFRLNRKFCQFPKLHLWGTG